MSDVTKLGACLVVGVLLLLTGAAAGWVINGWRMSAAVAGAQKERALDGQASAVAALADFAETASKVKEAADSYISERAAIAGKLDQLSKDLKNYAKDKPLPADCRPDAGRVRSLSEAVAAAKQAATR
ncbi:hypothetical protein PEP31012_00845 [Pandoraea eparura]|uniref:Uncharacterized protein n=1 Tax=Pandoraea eparura TaxID=2508291 RepID=A0A5E4SNR5_9BURK|nr:hypothetical protein [Pandoraea eparura]VVD76038.1 hypothetical protein PEP31012_00845 [Pandoraea eparura]